MFYCKVVGHFLLECAGDFEEELLLADGVGAEEEERALLVESLCPHCIQHKAQHLQQHKPLIPTAAQ